MNAVNIVHRDVRGATDRHLLSNVGVSDAGSGTRAERPTDISSLTSAFWRKFKDVRGDIGRHPPPPERRLDGAGNTR